MPWACRSEPASSDVDRVVRYAFSFGTSSAISRIALSSASVRAASSPIATVVDVVDRRGCLLASTSLSTRSIKLSVKLSKAGLWSFYQAADGRPRAASARRRASFLVSARKRAQSALCWAETKWPQGGGALSTATCGRGSQACGRC